MRIILFAIFGIWGVGGFADAVKKGDILDISVSSYEGAGKLDEASLSGKVNVVNFWATWCEACKVELVEMEEEFSSLIKENKDFQFSFVSLDKDPKKAEAWVKKNLKNPELFLKYLFKDPEFKSAEKLEIESFPFIGF